MTQYKLTARVTAVNGWTYGNAPKDKPAAQAQMIDGLHRELTKALQFYSKPTVEVTVEELGVAPTNTEAIQTPIASANTLYFVVDEDGYAEGSNGVPTLARAVTLAQEEAVANERDYYVTVPVKHIKYVDEPHTEVTDIVVLGSA